MNINVAAYVMTLLHYYTISILCCLPPGAADADLKPYGFTLSSGMCFDNSLVEPPHDKTTTWLCAQRRLRSAWESAQTSGFIRVREIRGILFFFKVRELSWNFILCQGKMKFCQNVREFYISVLKWKKGRDFLFQNNDFKYKRQSIFYHVVSPHLTD